jgi:putative cell wall-binding protein
MLGGTTTRRTGDMHQTSPRRAARFVAATLALSIVPLVATAAPASAATVQRIAGNDRYETAAAVSADAFDPGVPVAYVAVGNNFPDALAGAPAGVVGGGPVLLTRGEVLSPPTATELDRLTPGRIVILGGLSAVSAAVETALADHTDGTVTRIAGGNRNETAAMVSAAVFPDGAEVAHVATGAAFADALSGGPAAGVGDGPILLVEQNSIPPATVTELDRLDPDRIVVLGGSTAVSPQVEGSLSDYAPLVRRYSGDDRYATSVAVSAGTFPADVPTAYLATGVGFADALAGGPAAGLAPGPLLLTRPECLPASVKAELDRLSPDKIVVLGGTTAVSDAAANLTVCAGPAATFGDGQRTGSSLITGTFRTRTDSVDCYWERVSGFSDDPEDFEGFGYGPRQIATIKSGDAGFYSESCGTWSSDLSPLDASATAPVTDGMYFVGTSADVAPGTWTAPGGPDCYWERLSGFGGALEDLIVNGGTGSVTIQATDAGFAAYDCGTWTKVG